MFTITQELSNITGNQLIELANVAENTETRFLVDRQFEHEEWTLRWNRGRGKQSSTVYVHLFADVDDRDGDTGHYWRGGHGHFRGTVDQKVKDFKMLKISDWTIVE